MFAGSKKSSAVSRTDNVQSEANRQLIAGAATSTMSSGAPWTAFGIVKDAAAQSQKRRAKLDNGSMEQSPVMNADISHRWSMKAGGIQLFFYKL
ncbi:MAG: hypothetical protein OEU92_11660 [Alphaproteobacteria bacterium]|nr:hypothetical protein [Alphaproteobacteria bacterium]